MFSLSFQRWTCESVSIFVSLFFIINLSLVERAWRSVRERVENLKEIEKLLSYWKWLWLAHEKYLFHFDDFISRLELTASAIINNVRNSFVSISSWKRVDKNHPIDSDRAFVCYRKNWTEEGKIIIVVESNIIQLEERQNRERDVMIIIKRSIRCDLLWKLNSIELFSFFFAVLCEDFFFSTSSSFSTLFCLRLSLARFCFTFLLRSRALWRRFETMLW